MYVEQKLEFQEGFSGGGGGVIQTKSPLWEGYPWIFFWNNVLNISPHRVAKCGFYKLCQRSKEETESYLPSEELSRLVNHPRIALSTELIQEMTYGVYFLM